ncbi:MAG: GNAT family N-acetyltransferase [Candidatus Tumulicola sp.]
MRLYQEIGHVPPENAAPENVTATLIAEEPRYRALLAFAPHSEEPIGTVERDPIGVLTLCESCAPYAGGYFGTIQEFYIVPEMRSQGVGQAMLEYAREIALQKKWNRLEVTATLDPSFARSVAFYRSFGFRDSGPRLYLPTVSH